MKKKIAVLLELTLLLLMFTSSVALAADTDVYYECVDYELTASCDLKGDAPKDIEEVFTVVVKPDDRSPHFVRTSVGVEPGKIGSFGKINADKPDTFSYTVLQKKGANKHITYDATEFEVIVDVITNDAGLVAEKHTITNLKTHQKVDGIRFINIYESDSPDTGDDNRLTIWSVMLIAFVVSGIAVGAAYMVNKKRDEN